MAKKVKENESVFVDVDVNGDVVSVTNVAKDVDSHCGIDAVAEAINEVPKKPSSKGRKAKKVDDLALEVRISDLEDALSKCKDALEGTNADNERLADELGVSVAENKSLRKELQKVRQDYKKCQGDNRANSALIETINGELTRQKTQNKEMRETIGRLQDKIKQYADELSEKDKAISEKDFDIAYRDNAIVKAQESCANLVSKLDGYESMGFMGRLKFLFGKRKK
jgi:chromosome segregation ATPase